MRNDLFSKPLDGCGIVDDAGHVDDEVFDTGFDLWLQDFHALTGMMSLFSKEEARRCVPPTEIFSLKAEHPETSSKKRFDPHGSYNDRLLQNIEK